MLIFSLTFSFITSNSLTYDQQNHGLKYLFSLPIKKSQFVLEKYLMLLISIVIAIVLMTITSTIILNIISVDISLKNIFTLTYETGAAIYLFITIILQYQIKNGPEKTQQFMSILGAIVAVTIGGIIALIKYSNTAKNIFNNIYNFFVQNGNAIFLLIITIIIGIIIFLSYLKSTRNIKSVTL